MSSPESSPTTNKSAKTSKGSKRRQKVVGSPRSSPRYAANKKALVVWSPPSPSSPLSSDSSHTNHVKRRVIRTAYRAKRADEESECRGEEPGAYLVEGAEDDPRVERAETGLLSPHKHRAKKAQAAAKKTPAVASNATPIQRKAKPIAARSTKPAKGLVVAAELSSDVEAKIEEEVRRRILAQATKAQVVSVTHGAPMLDPKEEARRMADLKELHKPKGVREKLFGDSRNEDIDIESHPEAIRKRSFLNWTVKRNQATNLWVASVQTSQKASDDSQHTAAEMDKFTESFPAATQQEACEIGLANAVPVMQSPQEHPICHVCKAKFAMFRRPQHCKNCGVCVCTNCSTQWPSKMFPATYRAKATNHVCVACDWLAHSFREALLRANYKRALHLYGTGNVNIRNPFCLDKKAEVLYPVHLAILGGSLTLLHWLVSERRCPLTVPLKSNKKQVKGGKERAPLLTSKGRSPLVIALMHQKLDLVRYLVIDKGVGFFEEKDMNPNLALANFTTLLRMLTPDFFNGKTIQPTQVPHTQAQTHSSGSFANSPSTKQRRPSL